MKTAAIIFTIMTLIIILFQAALAIGLPWGAASMGGRFKGKYPPRMRIVAIINMLILALLAIIVLIKAGFLFEQLYRFSLTAIWFVVAFSVVATILNTITPSRIERIWAPVAATMAVTSIIIALYQV